MELKDITIKKETIVKVSLFFNALLALILAYVIFGGYATGRPDVTSNSRRFCIASDDGKCTLTIAAHENGVGLWVRKAGVKQYAYLYAGPNVSPYVALGDSSGIDPLALYLHDGKPSVQLKRDNGWESFNFEDLLKAPNVKPIGKSVGDVSRGALPPKD
jgi:hypothetical protein